MGFTWLFGTLAAFNYSEVVRDIFSGLFIVCNTFQVCAKLKWTLSCSTGFNLPTFVSTFASVTCTHHTSCGYGTFLLCILFAGSYSCCCFAYVCVWGGGMWVWRWVKERAGVCCVVCICMWAVGAAFLSIHHTTGWSHLCIACCETWEELAKIEGAVHFQNWQEETRHTFNTEKWHIKCMCIYTYVSLCIQVEVLFI